MPAYDLDMIAAEGALTDYAIGQLSPIRQVIVSCQKELNPHAAKKVSGQESIMAALMMESPKGKALSPEFIENVLIALPHNMPSKHVSNDNRRDGIAPPTLRSLLGHGLRDLQWRHSLPGVAIHDIVGNRHSKSERLYLMKVKAGMKMPEHTHNGEEWTLILQGSYSVSNAIFVRGDLHVETSCGSHAPQISPAEDCICLVMTEGRIEPKSPLARLLQPFIGI